MDYTSEPANRIPPETPILVDSLKDRLHALVVCLSHSWGGLEQVAANDAVDVGALGLDVRVLCMEGSPIHENLLNRKEVKLIPLNFQPRNTFDIKMRRELRRLMGEGVNLIHSHQTSLLASIIPWVWGKPEIAVLATRHILSQHQKKNPFHAAIYRRLDSLIVMSQRLRQNVLETHPIIDRRVSVIHLGLDLNRFNPQTMDASAQRARWGAEPGTILIGLVGRIDPAKGQGVFVKAAAGLLRNAKPDQKLKFIIVGEETLTGPSISSSGGPPSYMEELKEIVRQFRIENQVVFSGFHENIPEVMSALDIVVMPSKEEAFGLVAIEAMAMERPVIISSGGSAREIVGPNQEYGLLMRSDDAFDLQSRLRELLESPVERRRMALAGRGHIVRNFDRSVRLRKTLDVYDRALRRRGWV